MDVKLATRLVAITVPVLAGVPWLTFAAQFVDAIVAHLDSSEFEQNTRRALNDLRYEVRQVSTQVARQTYRHHVGTGRRILQDLALHRTPEGYSQAVDNAKTEFQRASAVATDLGSSDLVITAELAITGCWYLLQSPEGVQATLYDVCQIAGQNVLHGDRATVARYRQVLSLCKIFGAVPETWAIPIDPAKAPDWATLTAHAPLGVWADLWGASVLVTAIGHGAATVEFANQTTASVTVRLRRLDGILLSGAYQVEHNENVLVELGLAGPPKARFAVTVELPVSWGRPGAGSGPQLAFLLPEPGQLPATPPQQPQHGLYLQQPGYAQQPHSSPYQWPGSW